MDKEDGVLSHNAFKMMKKINGSDVRSDVESMMKF